MNDVTPRLLSLIQQGIAPIPDPFAPIAGACHISVDDLLDTLNRLTTEGLIRRFGAVFNAASLGYQSTLAATTIPSDKVDEIAPRLNPHPGITHSYLRNGEPNLWFTLTSRDRHVENDRAWVEKALRTPVQWLPALRKYKVQVIFGFEDGHRAPPPPPAAVTALEFSEFGRRLVRRLQSNIPFVANPWAVLAADTGMDEAEVLELVARWSELGALRRIAAVLRHRRAGIRGNAMALWRIDEADADTFGTKLAARPEITHCYLREMGPGIPGNLYAMLHAPTMDGVELLFRQFTEEFGLPPGQLFMSVKEYKKTSPQFFTELPDDPA